MAKEPVTRTSAAPLEETIAVLRDLLPEIFSEGKVDSAKLHAVLGDAMDDRPERYSFTWAGKRDAIRLLQVPSRATLVPSLDESVNFDATKHVFIDGENLEVLKLLYKSYFGQVKMIYIDPPYNTGNDFVYPDDYADPLGKYLEMTGQRGADGTLLTSNPETSGRYHSNWLTMMYPRLFVARQLLSDDGVIFVSIDDHEACNLRLVLNELFGEENFVGQIAVQVNPRGRHLDRFVAKTHEYVMVYARNADEQAVFALDKDERMTREYNKRDERGAYRELELRNRNPAFNRRTRPNLYYPIYVDPSSGDASLEHDAEHSAEVFPKNSAGADSCWTWSRVKFARERSLLIGRRTSDGSWRVFRKDYLISDDGAMSTTLPKALWLDKEINNDYGKKAIQELFDGETVFDFPKSPFLIERLLKIGMSSDDLVLDFFSGSATIAQAVMQLNRQDGGTRRFICIQLPEPTDNPRYPTLADIGKERVRRVIAKLQRESGGQLDLKARTEPQDLGMRVFKLAPSYFRPWEGVTHKEPGEYVQQMAAFADPLVEGWPSEGVIWEVAIKEGYSLISRVTPVAGTTVHRVSDPETGQGFLICLDATLSADTVAKLNLTATDTFICRDYALTDTLAANLALQCQLKTI